MVVSCTDIIREHMTTSTSETTVKLSIEELARAALEEASSNLGSDVVLLDTRNVSDFTDFFVIASGETERHLEMMADRIERKIRELGMRRNNREGSGSGGWLLIDFPGFIVHLFNRETRAYYDLEGLWSQANEVVRLQ
ncbi:MAG: ribosome silencing factor [Chloroflexi bacterium]|nr:ribosome silencing factor [Chloroflexota bacterium]